MPQHFQHQADNKLQSSNHSTVKSVEENPFLNLSVTSNPFVETLQKNPNPFFSNHSSNIDNTPRENHNPTGEIAHTTKTDTIQRNPDDDELLKKLEEWNVDQANLGIKLATLKEALAMLIRNGDALSSNTVKYVMKAVSTGELVFVKITLGANTEAKARQASNGFCIEFNKELEWTARKIGIILLHEVNHIKNEVGEAGINFTENPFKQFLTEFRAYIVGGNWPMEADKGVIAAFSRIQENRLKLLRLHTYNENSKKKMLSPAIDKDSDETQTQVAFRYIRSRIIAAGGQPIQDDTPEERFIRKKLAEIIKRHIYADYENARTKKENVLAMQEEVINNFIERGILPGNVLNSNPPPKNEGNNNNFGGNNNNI
jgi:hypothetical protein